MNTAFGINQSNNYLSHALILLTLKWIILLFFLEYLICKSHPVYFSSKSKQYSCCCLLLFGNYHSQIPQDVPRCPQWSSLWTRLLHLSHLQCKHSFLLLYHSFHFPSPPHQVNPFWVFRFTISCFFKNTSVYVSLNACVSRRVFF